MSHFFVLTLPKVELHDFQPFTHIEIRWVERRRKEEEEEGGYRGKRYQRFILQREANKLTNRCHTCGGIYGLYDNAE